MILARQLSIIPTILWGIAIFLISYLAVVLINVNIRDLLDPSSLGNLLFTMLIIKPLSFAPGAPFFSAATSLGVTVLSVFAVFVALMERLIARLEGRGIWHVLNTEKKPMVSASVLAIIIFSIFYWPIVIL